MLSFFLFHKFKLCWRLGYFDKELILSRPYFSVEEARQRARRRLPRMIFDFIDGASGDESLRDINSALMNDIRLMPRVMIDVSHRDLSRSILGMSARFPYGIAPMGMCALAWPGADVFLARAAAQRRIPLCVSTVSSAPLGKIIELAEGYAWFQLYADQSLAFVDELIDKSAAAGYKVLILTVDVPIHSVRTRDVRNGFTVPMQWGPRQIWDFATHPFWSVATILRSISEGMPRPMNYIASSQAAGFVRNASRGLADWMFLERLRDRWKGKLVVKGVLCPEDAVKIKSLGVDAIYVSNHGGRQLNAAPAAIEALGKIRAAVGDELPLIFDSGVRSGEHVIKALASGADFVMLGRSVLYGIGAGGARGLSNILELIEKETSAIMGLLGYTRLEGIDRNCLACSHEQTPVRVVARSVAE